MSGASEQMTVRELAVREVVAAFIGESDDRSRQLGERLAAWREGYAAGFAAGTEVGRGAEAHERDQLWSEFSKPISRRGPAGPGVDEKISLAYDHVERRRWNLRGEPRTRETFGQPHPGDYQGGAA